MNKLNDSSKLNLKWRSIFTGLLPLFVFAHFGHHLVTALPIPLLPMMRAEFGLDYTQSGLVISAFSLFYGISQLPAGWLADRIGPRILITIGICGVALAGFLTGLSGNYIMLIGSMVLMGVLGGGYHPAAPPLISAAVEEKNRGRAMGIHMAGGSLPFFLAPLIAVALASAWGWRASFIALAVPTAIFGVVFYILLGRYNQSRPIDQQTEKIRVDTTPSPEYKNGLIPFIIMSTTTHAITFAVVAFIPLFMIERFDSGQATAGAFLSIFYSAGPWASLLGGYVSDRFGSLKVVVTVCLLSGPMIYLITIADANIGVAALLLVLGICNYVRTPVSEAYIITRTAQRHRSTVLGIYYFSSMEGGGVLTPVMGYFIDRYGMQSGFTAAGLTLILLTVVCLFALLRNQVRKNQH
jgi:predicted MFS family arabinose efflux permease